MEICVEKRAEIHATEIKILVMDDYLVRCDRDPHARLFERMSTRDQLGLITDAVHTFMGVLPPKED